MNENDIFKGGSTTYYWSSKFFPEATRKDVQKLYSFVRVADDFVDQVPSDDKSFKRLVGLWRKLAKGKKIRQKEGDISTLVAQNMYDVAVKYNFDFAWIDAFLESMQMDIKQRDYKTLDDTLEYIYGSAEVIGLMMLAILRSDIGNSELR
jgi:phytoene synthase